MVEVYAMVVFRERGGNLSPPAQVYLKELRHTAREAERLGEKTEAKLLRRDMRAMESEAEHISYHFCRVRLVQPPQRGAKVPIPKWEMVEKYLTSYESIEPSDYADRIRYTPTQFLKLNYNDPYGDVGYWGKDCGYRRMCGPVKEVTVPDYLKQWENFLFDWDFDPEQLEPFLCLPLFHPIEYDRKVQLRQIRFLYPETRTMPMFAALDYVRDKL